MDAELVALRRFEELYRLTQEMAAIPPTFELGSFGIRPKGEKDLTTINREGHVYQMQAGVLPFMAEQVARARQVRVQSNQ